MTEQAWTVATFALCLLGFTLVGVWASRMKSESTEDYLLAGRSVSPWLTALSAVATNNSGYMFIGLIGYAYTSGVQAVWLQVAWVLGDYTAWRWVQKGVRQSSGEIRALSVSDWLGRNARVEGGGPDSSRGLRWVVLLSALLTFVFLGGYAAAQLKAGSVSMEVLFGWPPEWGAVIGTIIIVIYCFSGGMRASIWTDAAQSLVMIVSMTLLAGVGLFRVDGLSGLRAALNEQSPDLVAWAPAGTLAGSLLFVAGFLFGGLGGLGQPHILSRVMALRSASDIDRTRAYYFSWFLPFSLLALLVGLEARVILPDLLEANGAMGAEHALPLLSVELLPSGLVGLMLAGIFAATMSTADSQVLSCTAALTQDLFPHLKGNYRAAKLSTLVTAALALFIALYATKGVFEMVLMAWSVLGASLGPLVILRAFDRMPRQSVALTMMISGIATIIIWPRLDFPLYVYEIMPGIVVPFLVYAVSEVVTPKSPS